MRALYRKSHFWTWVLWFHQLLLIDYSLSVMVRGKVACAYFIAAARGLNPRLPAAVVTGNAHFSMVACATVWLGENQTETTRLVRTSWFFTNHHSPLFLCVSLKQDKKKETSM